MLSSPVRSRSASPRAPADGRREEIDGLRAVAVLLVAGYHVWFGRVSGGVDVFLLLSGFLITGSLVRAVEGRRFGFGPFLGRLAARLVPTAALVIMAVLVGTRLLLPEPRWGEVLGEATAAALYHLNWSLALDSVDYLARDDGTSPLQHFWSLSVQGQFYLSWPLLVIAAAWAATRARVGTRAAVAVALGAVFTLSLAWSVYMTRADQAWAYLDTGTRLWEFALGGLLALALPHLRLPFALRIVLGWAGVLALLLCGAVLQVSTVFPGYAALWPTLAACAIIVAGTTGSPLGADRWLTLRPVRYVGSLSYALYLWHWPLLVFYLAMTGQSLADPLGGAVVLAVSVALAAVTTPVADRLAALGRGALRRGATVTLACLFPVLVTTGAWSTHVAIEQHRMQELLADGHSYPGAAALAEGRPVPDMAVHPDPAHAASDTPVTYDDGCNQTIADAEVLTCVYGSEDPERTIALVGGSHAAHWFPALEAIAEERDWRVVTALKGACLFTDAPQSYRGEPYTACSEWNRGVMAELTALEPDAVFTTGTTTSLDTTAGYGHEQVVDGYPERWRELTDLGLTVVAVRDTPRFGFDVPACVSASGIESCSSVPEDSLAEASPLEGVDLPAGVVPLDMTDLFCEPHVCRPVVGNVLVYWDQSHIGATYMRTLAPTLEERLIAATGW